MRYLFSSDQIPCAISPRAGVRKNERFPGVARTRTCCNRHLFREMQVSTLTREHRTYRLFNWLYNGHASLLVTNLLRDGTSARVRNKNCVLSLISCRYENLVGIGRSPNKLIHPTVELWQQILHSLRRAVVEHQPELIALVAGAGLRAPGQVLAFGRVGGVEIPARRSRHLHRLCRRVRQIERINLRAGAGRRLRIRILGKGQLL